MSESAPTRRLWPLVLLLIALAVLMAGCSSSATSSRRAALTASSWPGMTVYDETVYVTFGQDVFALDPDNPDTAEWLFNGGRNRTFYAPPVVDDELVIAADYTDTLFALDRESGEEKWRFTSARSRFIGGAALDESHVYAGTVDGLLHALDRETGEEVWTFQAQRDIWSAPLLADGILYITSLDRHLYALDPESGEKLWQFPNGGAELDPPMGAIIGTPSYHDGVLYFGSLNNRLYALDAETQEVLWTYETSNWMWSSPLIDAESGLVIGGDLDGFVFALDIETGEVQWPFEANGPVVAAPVLDVTEDGERLLYFTSGIDGGSNNLYILDEGTGTEIESHSVTVPFTTRFLFIPTGTTVRPAPIYAAPVLIDDTILVGVHQGDYPLHALERESLETAWPFSPDSGAAETTSAEGEQPEQSPLQRFTSFLLPFLVAMLLFSLLTRGRQAQQK